MKAMKQPNCYELTPRELKQLRDIFLLCGAASMITILMPNGFVPGQCVIMADKTLTVGVDDFTLWEGRQHLRVRAGQLTFTPMMLQEQSS